ncbi:carboxy-S-adenosyl-L-methionine synthase CmoA [Idiomarina aminovorans]|uniref:carboxy-S-adenosyl-L-methionine synthase CmoA n=1 Tax=Idiomarina aminovorans TaxID=2914829 RepID=UPI002004E3B3|nr:carboxy-S-adenosyl-L-methionine synthase CmoA [Idiomarina sp. ATCH4]MCK7458098.1 carboxy-S-adenosyl-L-methionine synthase CmoA [Idiomarina sp. ATCH4]
MTQHDTIFSKPLPSISDFCFDQHVVEVFPDMINRSVPGYSSILQTLPQLVSQYVQPNSHLYDLGCSLGAATLAMRKGCERTKHCKIIGIDNAQPMIERAQLHLDGYRSDVPVELICQDLTATTIENASVVVLNFTLQFIPEDKRGEVIQNIFNGMNKGGALLISEKIRHPDTQMNDRLIDLHHDFKRANGYSELEISQKRAAIENVMKVDTLEAHQQRFEKAGFKHSTVWFQCFNFAAMLAVK